jgi:acrylyl-CoA reductase (NADPH)
MFKALLLEKGDTFSASIQSLDEATLPPDDVLVQVDWSSLNYKDGLAITNKGPVVRQWPMVAGIDGAGVVLESSHPQWQAGDAFIHNGWGVGETHWGCLAEKARLKGDWLVKLPAAFTARQAMAIGTAGYTAMLCVLALEDHGVKPGAGEILVTGATGGVGSVAVALLGRLGYTVVAATGKTAEADWLKALGASPSSTGPSWPPPASPSRKSAGPAWWMRWARTPWPMLWRRPATAAWWPPAGWPRAPIWPTTVMPFILRGVTLAGVDSVMAPLARRQRAWDRLARDLDPAKLETLVEEIPLPARSTRPTP